MIRLILMSLPTGSFLGPYELLAPIGAGDRVEPRALPRDRPEAVVVNWQEDSKE